MGEIILTPEELEAIEREKEARREEIRGKIRELVQKQARLEEYKTSLLTEGNAAESSVNSSVKNYDLSVSTDIQHWAGNLETKGELHQNGLANAVSKYISDINSVIGSINVAKGKIQSEISSLESELNSI